MAKIKDCVVIDAVAINATIEMFKIINNDKAILLVKFLTEMMKGSKPLEPIAKDAFDAQYSWNIDFEQYLNDTEI